MSPVFAPGSTILRREVLHSQVWLQSPVTVIADNGSSSVATGRPAGRTSKIWHRCSAQAA